MIPRDLTPSQRAMVQTREAHGKAEFQDLDLARIPIPDDRPFRHVFLTIQWRPESCASGETTASSPILCFSALPYLPHAQDMMLYCQCVVTPASLILSVCIVGSLHKVYNFFSTFSTRCIIVKQQNDSIESITFCALIQTHFFTAMHLIAAFIFQFF